MGIVLSKIGYYQKIGVLGSDPRECSLDCFLTYRVLDRLPNDSETKTLGRIAQRVAVHGTP
jgi:hypothetical protein